MPSADRNRTSATYLNLRGAFDIERVVGGNITSEDHCKVCYCVLVVVFGGNRLC